MPLYGTCTASRPASVLNSSPARWFALPTPGEEKLSCPGFDLASATSSFTDFTPSAGDTTRMLGTLAIRHTPAKSLKRVVRQLGEHGRSCGVARRHDEQCVAVGGSGGDRARRADATCARAIIDEYRLPPRFVQLLAHGAR